MPCRYAARLRNARRIGWRIKRALQRGAMVLDADGERIRSVSFTGFGKGSVGLTLNDSLVLMDADVSLDNGMRTPIRAFNAGFAGWTIIHPQHMRPLLRGQRTQPCP